MRRLVLVTLIVLFLAGGLLGFLYLTGRMGSPVEKTEPVTVHSLGEFITNLRGDGGRHYIRVRIDVELTGSRARRELEEKGSLVRDVVLAVLRGQSVEELTGEEGMGRLRGILRDRLNQVLEHAQVGKVLFVEFVIQ
ncbi:MAG: flagellar basal body-associated FliL family protein [Bacillota bacterium]